MFKKNLNENIIKSGNIEWKRLTSFQHENITVYFYDLEEALVKYISESKICVGCVAWLSNERILKSLSNCSLVSIIIQKEDFLRPDKTGVQLNWRVKQDPWKTKLRKLYDSLPKGISLEQFNDDEDEDKKFWDTYDPNEDVILEYHENMHFVLKGFKNKSIPDYMLPGDDENYKILSIDEALKRRDEFYEKYNNISKNYVVSDAEYLRHMRKETQIEPIKISYQTDWKTEAIRCLGDINKDNRPAFPRMHHKFLIFFDRECIYDPSAVWTGSFNFTSNATKSLENGVYIKDAIIAKAFWYEWVFNFLRSEALDWNADYDPELRLGS